MVSDARVLMSESVGFAAICSNDAASYPEDSFENTRVSRRLMISRFHTSTTRPRQSLGRIGRSVRRTSSVTMPTASSSIAAGSTRAAQLRLGQGRPESLSRPCVRLRPPVWHRLTKRRLLAAQSNGRTNKAEPSTEPFGFGAVGEEAGACWKPFPRKPKGMRRAEWLKLSFRCQQYERKGILGTAAVIERLSARLRRDQK